VRLADPAVLTKSDVVIMSVRVTCRSVVGRRGSYGLCQISWRLGGAGVTYSSDELWAAIVIFLARGSRSIGAPRAEQMADARQIVTTEPAPPSVTDQRAGGGSAHPWPASGEPAAGETTAPGKGSEGVAGMRWTIRQHCDHGLTPRTNENRWAVTGGRGDTMRSRL
jgi:hypothetical protein